ncbi:hypothetical protein [Deinococcus arenicola]|uniref:Outer membrane protein beta-barrel domain-containing protein n=1 Tax=Deinococcus arenicola TaxID=2994950 RepID=A0ABU4DLP1_9DEIO|nr:hypothetical protein [Deinococcus sp. ZS9-10]MDV6373361.1 hypothetical protein [Deinococcus sp. ZS9-10]
MPQPLLARTLALAFALTATLASAQTAPVQTPPELVPTATPVIISPPVVLTPQPLTPASDRFTVWGGVGTEFYLLPGVMLGASVPVGRLDGIDLGIRASAEATIIPLPDATGPIPFVNVDLLFSGSGRGLRAYGGPSVGTVLGYAWLLGGVGGVRGDFGAGPWGYFAEAKARVLYAGGGGGALFAPGVNLGVTYRF